MSIIVIGDRGVGKTSMVVELSKTMTPNITVESPESDSFARFYNPDEGIIAGTRKMEETPLTVVIDLPSGEKRLQVRWVDTPGEAFTNSAWKNEHLSEWQHIRKEVKESQGIMLLLPPYRTLIQPHLVNNRSGSVAVDDFPNARAWSNRLQSWFKFFIENCNRSQHILLCIHKADLFCDIENEARKWRYTPTGNKPWFEHNQYVFNSYFSAARELVEAHNRKRNLPYLRMFITTTEKPDLLELPWIYLGSYLANSID